MFPDTVLHASGNEKSERFLVHFAAFNGFDLDEFLTELRKEHPHTIVKGSGSSFQTIEIEILPSQLRQLQQTMPRSVIVSYEVI
jgi:hypothetical protein